MWYSKQRVTGLAGCATLLDKPLSTLSQYLIGGQESNKQPGWHNLTVN